MIAKTESEIKEIVGRLGNAKMTATAHGWDKCADMKIIDAAMFQAKAYATPTTNPAVALMTVVLAANRNYNRQVKPHAERMTREYAKLTIRELQQKLSTMDYEQFKLVWGHRDKKKYNVLKQVVDALLTFGDSSWDDQRRASEWASQSCLSTRKHDPLGRIANLGVATFQHLRMTFGVDTVKPDQRVKEVLKREFKTSLSSEKAIHVVESIASITGYRVIEIDQIFVKYGSGYYVAKS